MDLIAHIYVLLAGLRSDTYVFGMDVAGIGCCLSKLNRREEK